MHPKYFTLISLVTLLISCNLRDTINQGSLSDAKYKRVVSDNNIYTAWIPEFMTANKQLHEEATMQYANLFKEFYFVVIAEDKHHLETLTLTNEVMQGYFPDRKVNADTYFRFFVQRQTDNNTGMQFLDSSSTAFNNLKGRLATATMMMQENKTRIFYRIAALEGKKKVYQVLVWTLDKYKEDYRPVMDSMIRSIREL